MGEVRRGDVRPSPHGTPPHRQARPPARPDRPGLQAHCLLAFRVWLQVSTLGGLYPRTARRRRRPPSQPVYPVTKAAGRQSIWTLQPAQSVESDFSASHPRQSQSSRQTESNFGSRIGLFRGVQSQTLVPHDRSGRVRRPPSRGGGMARSPVGVADRAHRDRRACAGRSASGRGRAEKREARGKF